MKTVDNNIPNDKYVKKALKLIKERDYNKALELLKKSLKNNPYNRTLIYNLTLGYTNLGKFNNAIKYLKDIIEIEPNNAESWFYLGRTQKKAGQFEEAIKSIDESLKLNPNNPTTLTLKANCYSNMGDIDNALKYYDQAIMLDPTYNLAIENKIKLLKELGRVDEAEQVDEQVMEILRKNPELVGIKEIIIPQWQNFGLKFFNIGGKPDMTLEESNYLMASAAEILNLDPDHMYFLIIKRETIAVKELYPGAYEEFQKVTKIPPIQLLPQDKSKKLFEAKKKAPKDTKICPNCYLPNENTAKFCMSCGEKLMRNF